MTSRVSIRTSRSAVSDTSAAASGAAGLASSAGVAAGDAVPPAGAPLPANAGDDDGEVSTGRPFGTGFTNRACQAYRTINARKMARRTRRSIYVVRLEPPFDWLRAVLSVSKDRTLPRGAGTGSWPAAHIG